MASKVKSLLRVFSALVLAGVLGFSAKAYSAEVSHITLQLEDALGVPAVQALIVACIGEPVFFTGTVHITVVDGVPTYFNWGPMTGTTADGDLFVGGSGVVLGRQANLTLVEVGAPRDSRQLHLQIVQGDISDISVVCH